MDFIEIEKWKGYKPLQSQYAKYFKEKPNSILAGLKISDVYIQICNARKSLEYIHIEAYGGLALQNDTDNVC